MTCSGSDPSAPVGPLRLTRLLSLAVGCAALCLIFLGPVGQASAQAPGAAERIRLDVTSLASPTFAGRGIGTPGVAAAAGYLVARLVEIGVEPGVDGSYFQPIVVKAIRAHDRVGSFTVGETSGRVGESVQIAPGWSDPHHLTAPVTLIRWTGDSTALPDGFKASDLDGHIVLVERLDHPANPISPEASALVAVVNRAKPAGNFRVQNGLVEILAAEKTGIGNEEPAWAYRSVNEPMPQFGGGIDAGLVAEIFGPAPDPNTLDTIEVTTAAVNGEVVVTFGHIETHRFTELNVIGKIPGTAGAADMIALSAHYDHLGMIGEDYFPGADDNASGVAAILEAMRSLAADPPKRDVQVIFFAGEEHGLIGSRAFSRNRVRQLENLGALINIDAIGRSFFDDPALSDTILAGGLHCFPEIERAISEGARVSGLMVTDFSDFPPMAMMGATCDALRAGQGGAPSDQIALLREGVPGILLLGGLNADYHQPGDTADKVDMDRLARVAALLVATVRAIGAE